MSIQIACPFCQAQMKAPDSVIGKKVKCPTCKQAFMISAGEDGPPPPPSPVTEEPPFAPGPQQDYADDYEAQPAPRGRPRSQGGQSPSFLDYLLFRRMIAPILIQVLFWAGVAGCFIMSLVTIISGMAIATVSTGGALIVVLTGLAYMVIGPILVRVYCEIIIVMFRIYETLTEIKDKLPRPPV
jgi:predicted Zn finger-like uncharacterized protein